MLFDIDLQGLASAAHDWGTPLPKVQHDRFPQVLATGKPALSETFVGQVSGQQQVAVAVPVMRDGHAIARLEMVFNVQRFADLLARQNFASEWTAAVFDRKDVFVARTREAGRFVGQGAGERFRSALDATPEGSFEGNTADGIPVVAMYSRSGKYGWTVAIGVPVKRTRCPTAALVMAVRRQRRAVVGGRPVAGAGDRPRHIDPDSGAGATCSGHRPRRSGRGGSLLAA